MLGAQHNTLKTLSKQGNQIIQYKTTEKSQKKKRKIQYNRDFFSHVNR